MGAEGAEVDGPDVRFTEAGGSILAAAIVCRQFYLNGRLAVLLVRFKCLVNVCGLML